MGQLVVNGGMCTCATGVPPCSLVFLPTHTTTSSNQPAVNIMDYVPFLNVFGFSMYNSMASPAVTTAIKFGAFTPAACISTLPTPWVSGAIKTKMGRMPTFDSSSILKCAYGDAISIAFAGEVTITVS